MIKLMSATLSPAYGRDYKSQAFALKDFRAGKDFILQPAGRYCSIRDFAPGARVCLRYKRMTMQVYLTIEGEKDGNVTGPTAGAVSETACFNPSRGEETKGNSNAEVNPGNPPLSVV